MILAIASAFLSAAEPAVAGHAEIVAPYVNCLRKQRDNVAASHDLFAGSEDEAAKIEAQLRAEVLRLCATQRRIAKARAIKVSKTSSSTKLTTDDSALVESLLTYADGLFPPIVVSIAGPIPEVTNASN